MKHKPDPTPKTLEQMTPVQMIQMAERLGQLQSLAGVCRQTLITTLANQTGPGPIKNYLSKFLICQKELLMSYAMVFASLAGTLPPPASKTPKNPQ